MLERQLLARLGIGKPLIEDASARARLNGTDIECELLAGGQISPAIYYEAMAECLGVPFMADIAPECVIDNEHLDTQLIDPSMLRVSRPTAAPIIAICPRLAHLPALIERCAESENFREALAVAAPDTIREAVWQAGSNRRLAASTNRLFDRASHFSARVTFSGAQGFVAGIATTVLAGMLVFQPDVTLQVMHVALALLYMLSLFIRILAVRQGRAVPPPLPTGDAPLPVYTILVALYREENIVPQLVHALRRIDWPASRLDIKLVCEADDAPTLAAVRRHATAPQFEIVAVPPSLPRTKPKALTYALNAARGEFLVIYDAEDRPHPLQLREAFARFAAGDERLACLQAPLVIANAGNHWISALFALEYSALFRAILPRLASLRLPMPLGGTSNHFKTAALIEAGGWDPYNVTEDADLGTRLSRLGWHCGMLTRPTLEDAPEAYRIWHNQRSRWFKGWMQTLLVHLRNPVQLMHEIGPIPALTFVGTTGGMLFTAIAHPALILTLAATSLSTEGMSAWETFLYVVDLCNLFGSYAIFAALGRLHMTEREQQTVRRRWIAIPLYWIMISLASWKSIFELWARPHFWQKTPHTPAKKAG
ncbi:glycosyltransferase [Rhizobium sp. L1K21]|uniref:glycosyltransferase n=1 Tax=Rhizobium sp. L1K21 TaxID=2954933 RepID=UPI002093008C|nr:glycosyltransferase [Rhizobium sp. L1K21]MCO6187185.1 glycosyltransferase [Rhizobium sp. L1K21]